MTVTGALGSQMLVALLSQLSNSQTASQPPQPQANSPSFAPASGCAAPNALTGPSSPQLSSSILDALMQLQQDSGTSSTNGAAMDSSQDPMQQLFTAMDTDGDGSVSQTEMESYIEDQGGTQTQADQLFQSLDTSGSGALSESQMAQAAQTNHHHHHIHHHHHHHGDAGAADSSQSSTDPASTLDTDNDGSDGDDNFTDLLTGGSTDSADAIIGAAGTDGSSSTSQTDFIAALQNLQQNQWGMVNVYASAPGQTNLIASV